MGLTLSELLPELKASLQDAAAVFTADDDADFVRHLSVAAHAVSLGKVPRTLIGELTLTPGSHLYAAPDDLLLPKSGFWTRSPVDVTDIPGQPPPVLSLCEIDGAPMLLLSPPPSAAQIAVYGSAYGYYYLAQHQMTADALTSTLPDRARNLVLLRAQAEACREMAFRQIHKPVSLRAGGGSTATTRNMTPSALFEALMAEYERTPA